MITWMCSYVLDYMQRDLTQISTEIITLMMNNAISSAYFLVLQTFVFKMLDIHYFTFNRQTVKVFLEEQDVEVKQKLRSRAFKYM